MPLLIALTVGAPGHSQVEGDSAFARLHAAYLARDAQAAAATYAEDAEVVYRGSRTADERYQFSVQKDASFRAIFAQFKPDERLGLIFRWLSADHRDGAGVDRLRAGTRFAVYVRFVVRFNDAGLFTSDISASASRDQFEDAPGGVLVAPDDEDLEPAYYDAFP